MGKVLKVLGVLFLIIIVGVIALLVWAHGEGDEQMDRFFRAVETGEPEKVRALMVPELAETFDPPVLEIWLDAFNSNMGKFTGLAKSEFSTNKKTTSAGTVTEIEGKALFEKGEAKVAMNLIDGRISYLKIPNETLGENWFRKPETEFYREKAETFIKCLAASEGAQAMAMMHPALSRQFQAEELDAAMDRFREKTGTMKSIEFTDERFVGNDEGGRLRLMMKYVGEKETVPAYVGFEFVGMKGELVAFKLPGVPGDDS
ncbi:MAG: hypothetical protein KGY81_06390 [Phycisphaerae bacterium]|nr:hypothetical protein [Phycisphaerae bacterium]